MKNELANMCYLKRLISLSQHRVNYLSKIIIKVPISFIIYFSLVILFTNCVGLQETRYTSQGRHLYRINKADDFYLRLDEITKATYGIINITYYGHPLNKKKGTIIIHSGVGYVLKIYDHSVLITASHVLNAEETTICDIFGYPLSFEKIANRSFVLSNKNEIFMVIKTLKEYLVKKGGGGGIVDNSVYDGIYNYLKAAFNQSLEISGVNQISDRDKDISFVTLTDVEPMNSIPIDYMEESPEIRLGKQVAVYGFPNSSGAHYREGVISKTDSYDFIKNKYYPYCYHTDIILSEGDSGAPIISTSNDGKLKIFGMVLSAMPNQPRLGKVISSEYIKEKLKSEGIVRAE